MTSMSPLNFLEVAYETECKTVEVWLRTMVFEALIGYVAVGVTDETLSTKAKELKQDVGDFRDQLCAEGSEKLLGLLRPVMEDVSALFDLLMVFVEETSSVDSRGGRQSHQYIQLQDAVRCIGEAHTWPGGHGKRPPSRCSRHGRAVHAMSS